MNSVTLSVVRIFDEVELLSLCDQNSSHASLPGFFVPAYPYDNHKFILCCTNTVFPHFVRRKTTSVGPCLPQPVVLQCNTPYFCELLKKRITNIRIALLNHLLIPSHNLLLSGVRRSEASFNNILQISKLSFTDHSQPLHLFSFE